MPEAPVIDITSANSFLQWKQPQNSLIGNQSDTHSVSLMFRSRQPNGVLFTIQSFSTLEQFIIEVTLIITSQKIMSINQYEIS